MINTSKIKAENMVQLIEANMLISVIEIEVPISIKILNPTLPD